MTNAVTNIRTLKAMEKEGHIKLHTDTGSKVRTLSGGLITCVYICDYANSCVFVYKGNKYIVKYVSGCFYPFVFHYNAK